MMAVGIGILGFAHGHVEMYCARWRQSFEDRIQLVAGWDHDPSRATAACQRQNMTVRATVEELLADSNVDAVIIASETSLHAELAVKAAQAGKPIVMQKPLALTLQQADQIVTAVEKAAVPFTMAWQMRVDPQNLRMKELIQEGVLGRVVMVRRKHGLATHTWADFENTWHVRPELNRGMWADDAAHAVDFIHWLMGEPESVMAEVVTLLNSKIPDDQGIAVFRYPDGTLAEVFCSFTCIAGENTTEIIGDKGVVIQNYGDVPSCGAPRNPSSPGLKWYLQGTHEWVDSGIPSPPNHGERIAGLAEPILEFLEGKRPALACVQEGRTSLKMTLACHESEQTGKRIALSQYRG